MAEEWRDWKRIAEGQEANVASLSALVDEYRQALQEAFGALIAVRDKITNEAMDDLDLAGWCEGVDHWLADPRIETLARDALRVEQPRQECPHRYTETATGRCFHCGAVAEPEREGAE